MTNLRGKSWKPYLWLLPSTLLIAIFVVYPILIVFRLSFTEISKAGVAGEFVGFQNYVEAVSLPAFKTVMLNTLWWVLLVVLFRIVTQFVSASPEIVTGEVAFPPNVTFVTDNPTISFTSDLPFAAPLNSSL